MGGDRWFSISFWLCCALIAVPLWSVEYLPMADLPQHAAQISIWTRWHDAKFGYPEIYTQNWFTPYLFGYLLTFLFTPFMSVKAALTTVIMAALVGVPLATRLLIRQIDGNRWWVFAVFPSLFGFAFDWGFYNFLVGIPIALLLTLAALRFAAQPTILGGVALSLGMAGLFYVHVLLFAYVSVIFGLTVLVDWGGWKKLTLSLLPIVVLIPMVLLWLYITRDTEAMTHRAMMWELPQHAREGHRLLRFFAEVAGDKLTVWAFALGLAAFALPLVLGARPSRSTRRWIPLVVTLFAYFAVPHEFLGTAFLYSRYAIFAVPMWLYAMERDPAHRPPMLRLLAGPILAVACLAATTVQFWRYEPGVLGLGRLIDEMPENARVLSVPTHRWSAQMRTPVFLHTPLWYQAEKGGVVDFSFAINFPPLFRYRAEHEPKIPRMFVWDTNLFDWEAFDGPRYDYLIIREFHRIPSPLIVDSGAPVSFVGNDGPWQLFERK
jgi:hypothetical protein